MIRVIASDFDWTFGSWKGIPPENLRAVQRWRKAGNVFCILTGREPQSAIDVLQQYGGQYDYLLASSGTVQMDQNNAILAEKRQHSGFLSEIAAYTLTLPVLNFRVFQGKERYRLYIPGHEDDQEAGTCVPADYDKLPYFNQFSLLFEKDEEAESYCQVLNERYGSYIHALRNGRCVDVPPAGWSKTEGLRWFLKNLGVPEQQAVTIGDNYNDIDMVTAFSGYAVESGVPELKSAAHGVVKSVAELIDRLLEENQKEASSC